MYNRSRKETNQMMPYYVVIGIFCVICVVAVLVTVLSPKQKFADKEIIDESEMFIHNG